MVGGIVGPAVSGLLLERTGGDYAMVFTYLGVMAFIGVILMGCIKVVKIRNR
jgi:OFA family oxalate/formate antiporter-like MFS transporter